MNNNIEIIKINNDKHITTVNDLNIGDIFELKNI